MVVVFIGSLILLGGIGVLSSVKKTNDTKDYLLAGQDVQPWLVALSAVATNNSGYMFIGMIGYTYSVGLASIWLMIGWIVGDFLGSVFVYGRLSAYSAKYNLYSFSSLLSNNKGKTYKQVKGLTGLISVLFLCVYAAAQLSAGGKALFAILDWQQSTGIIIGALLVVAYCFSGGIRASIWTDAAQSFIMIFAMSLLLYYAVMDQNGWDNAIEKLSAVSTNYLSFFGSSSTLERFILFTLGWFFAGFGVLGQPHIMVRYMTLKPSASINRVRMYYYGWFIAFYCVTIGVGLMARIVLNESGNFDPELALPLMSLQLLPPSMVGLVLAGIFAATISTADSLIISCTAAFTNDLLPKLKHNYSGTKLVTLVFTSLAMFIALMGSSSVFAIVIYAWAVLGSSFGPLLTLKMLDKKVNSNTSLMMILIPGVLVIFWNTMGYSSIVYEMLPGILSGFLIYGIQKKRDSIKSLAKSVKNLVVSYD